MSEEKMREEFEIDAAPYGFDLARHHCAAPEPWSEYRNNDTGHRWAGWQAACAHKDAEFAKEREQFKRDLAASDAALRESRANDMESMRQLAESRSLIAMQAEALAKVQQDINWMCNSEQLLNRFVFAYVDDAISSSSESVAAWEDEKLEPLRREVAMMRELMTLLYESFVDCVEGGSADEVMQQAFEAINDTKATAEAYERELKAKALEEHATWCDSQAKSDWYGRTAGDMASRNAAEIRAQSAQKKEGE